MTVKIIMQSYKTTSKSSKPQVNQKMKNRD